MPRVTDPRNEIPLTFAAYTAALAHPDHPAPVIGQFLMREIGVTSYTWIDPAKDAEVAAKFAARFPA